MHHQSLVSGVLSSSGSRVTLLCARMRLTMPHMATQGARLRPFTSARPPSLRTTLRPARAVPQTTTSEQKQTAEYNRLMQQKMGWDHLSPYEYHPERGLYWHEVGPNLICGSQPQTPDDISRLREAGVTTIVNLQQDQDMQHWNVNCQDIQGRCRELGIAWVHRPARDFDPHSLRKVIPAAVQAVHYGLKDSGRVYVHCTAGLGRAPAVCIAYLHWFTDMQLDEAYAHLTALRPCGPKRDAIRGATYDLMSGADFANFERLPSHAFASMNPTDRSGVQQRCINGV